MTIDEAQAELLAAGWSTGDAAFRESDALVWLVYCHRDEVKLVASGSSRSEAWREAVRMACEKDSCGGCRL